MDEISVLCQTRGSEFQYLKEFYLLEIIFTLVNCAYPVYGFPSRSTVWNMSCFLLLKENEFSLSC
jgi:hypothetical protein